MTSTKKNTNTKTIWSLLVANSSILILTIIFGWDAGDILFIYWLETAIIAIFNVPKMILVRQHLRMTDAMPGKRTMKETLELKGLDMDRMPLVVVLPFFIFHIGIFMLVHAVFLHGFGVKFTITSSTLLLLTLIVPLLAHHTYSFISNFLGKQEYKNITVGNQMMAPYSRVFVMHLVVIFGGFLAMLFENTIGPVILLVLLKTAMDAGMHKWFHATKSSPA